MPTNNTNSTAVSYLDLEARQTRQDTLVRNDYGMGNEYPDNLETYEVMNGRNVFNIQV